MHDPLIKDTGCCYVPVVVELYFDCCAKLLCCPEQQAPTEGQHRLLRAGAAAVSVAADSGRFERVMSCLGAHNLSCDPSSLAYAFTLGF